MIIRFPVKRDVSKIFERAIREQWERVQGERRELEERKRKEQEERGREERRVKNWKALKRIWEGLKWGYLGIWYWGLWGWLDFDWKEVVIAVVMVIYIFSGLGKNSAAGCTPDSNAAWKGWVAWAAVLSGMVLWRIL